MIINQIVICILIFLILPYLVGGLATFFMPKEDSFAFRMVSGYFIEFALFELIALPGIFLSISLHLLIIIYGAVLAVLVILSLILCKLNTFTILKNTFAIFKDFRKNALLIAVMAMVVVQTIFISTQTHIDNDDAFYVASAETSVTTDTIMKYDPYTGELYDKLPKRYVFSPFMSWNAVVSEVTDIKPAVMAHVIFPLALIPLAYMVYYLWFRMLQRKKENLSPGLGLFFVFLIFSFSGYSVFSQGRFLLTRIWQGKAVLAGILLPAVLYYAVYLLKRKFELKNYIWFFVMMTACSMVSQMGIMLGAIMLGICFLIYTFEKKRVTPLLGYLLSCICNLICMAGYLIMK